MLLGRQDQDGAFFHLVGMPVRRNKLTHLPTWMGGNNIIRSWIITWRNKHQTNSY